VEAIYRRIVKRYPDAATRRYVLAELASLDQSEGLRFSSETSGVKGTTYHPYSENIQAAPDLAVRN
jgi:hypothetical protein